MKGHMCLKSGPYAVTSSKYTAQLLVKSNMNAHQRMIANAKPAIDNSVPKGWQNSTKVRDQLKRDMIKNGRPPPRSSSRTSQHSSDQDRYKDDLFDDDPAVGAIVRNHLPRRGRSPSPNAVLTMGRPTSAPPPPNTQTPRYQSSGDVLIDRSHAFTEPDRPFTPRTLKSTRKSKLSEFKYYNAPPPKKNGKLKTIESKTATTSENLTFEPLRSRDFRTSNQDVPRLDMTVDEDHRKWLVEQATKAKVRTSARQENRNGTGPIKPVRNGFGGTTELRRSGTGALAREEEEMKYLDFVNEVTSDILDRGIYTNKALQSVFDRHVEKNMNHLSVKRMNELLEKLRQDLGIAADDSTSQSRDVDVESRASSRGSGLERYRRNLERTLENCDLDVSVAKEGLRKETDVDELLRDFESKVPQPETASPSHAHPAPEIPEHLLAADEDVVDSHVDVLSDISAPRSMKSQRSNISGPKSSVKSDVRSAKSETRSAKSDAQSVRSDARSAKSDVRSVRSDAQKSELSVKSTGSKRSVKSDANSAVAKSDVSEPRSNGSAARSKKSTLTSVSKLDELDETGTRALSPDTHESGELTPRNHVDYSDDEDHKSDHTDKTPTHDRSSLNKLANDMDQLDLNDDASTLAGGSSLNSTMRSEVSDRSELNEEDKWMKNPSTFTMTLKPGQLNMSTVKPKPRARRRMAEERKSSLVESPRSDNNSLTDKTNGNLDDTETRKRPKAPPRAGSRTSSVRSTSNIFDDGPDDF